MNIRAKLADQYDHQTGPYNPFKINPPPTPLWLDDTFDLVPKGAKVPDDFFYGFMKPDPETLHSKFKTFNIRTINCKLKISIKLYLIVSILQYSNHCHVMIPTYTKKNHK